MNWARALEIEENEGHVEIVDKWMAHDRWRFYISLTPSKWAISIDAERIDGWLCAGIQVGPLSAGVMWAVSA